MLRIGRIVGAHALKGALRLRLDNPDSDSLERARRIFVERGGEPKEFKLLGVSRLNATTLRITIEGIADANAADEMKGAIAMLAPEDVPPPAPGEFYYYQAIGCEVFLVDGSSIGKIEEVFSNGAQDIWVVRHGDREILIPVIADVVKAMDFDARRVTIDPIPGLLD
ncbi:MAG: ribosome maturation factor RimM [Candidatus Binatus sp.]|uniref:ribosome maturation factor RimM n=1 Tax=Candidatus Binatus sp. TaxID=2811406 RepID=UPI002727F7F0|nr:ribosome maturation factor RimM [Candidatus Binatus sp.]MDO8433100.1 ribosome maturation factor RimM [Candidatus Binatus sp.]